MDEVFAPLRLKTDVVKISGVWSLEFHTKYQALIHENVILFLYFGMSYHSAFHSSEHVAAV